MREFRETSLFFPPGVVVGSICQPFFLLKYCTCSRLFVSSDGEGRMLIRATALPLAHFRHLYRFFGTGWGVNEKCVTVRSPLS